MTIKALAKYKKVLLLGYGLEGKTTELFFKKFLPQCELSIADEKFGSDYLTKQDDADLVIKTPGIRPEKVYKPYTTATNIFFANTRLTTIGVTGTKGKSTTVTLLKLLLENSGAHISLLGNIGKPMLSSLIEGEKTGYAVVELSSYQLEDIAYSPHIAVLLNIYTEHHNHKSYLDYAHAKSLITAFQTTTDYFVYNDSFPYLSDIAHSTKAKSIAIDLNKNVSTKNKFLVGPHNKQNIQAVYSVGKLLRIKNEIIEKSVEEYCGLPHRLQFVGKYNTIQFYNDSASNNPASTQGALAALKKVDTLFLGGQNRGFDYSSVVDSLSMFGVTAVILFPDTDKSLHSQIHKKYGEKIKLLETKSMKDAVKFAFNVTPKNGTCLLSPGAPSYLMYDNFSHRGEDFVKNVITYA